MPENLINNNYNNNGNDEMTSTPQKELNFFDKILEIITGVGNEERIKLRKLKEINKDLSFLKYKFYNYKKEQIQTSFPQYIYEIYRITQNFTKYFDVRNHANTIKLYLFEFGVPKKQTELRQKLEKEKIEELIRQSKDVKKAFEDIKATLNEFIKSFDSDIVRNINATYNQIVDLSNITNFDWYFFIHKFDSAITEANFNYKPNFELLDGKYILDELIAINDYLYSLDLNADWKNLFEYLKGISGENSLIDLLKKLIQLLKVLKKEDYLTKMIKLISKDPYFKPKEFVSKSKIVQEYIHTFQTEIQNVIQTCIKEMNKEKINKLLLEIFRTTVIVRLKNYSQRINDFFLNKGVSASIRYVEPLNYLKAFLLDICKGEIKPRVDLLIIKGTWESNTLSSEYSTMLEQFNALSDKIIEFDNSCGEDETYGREIRKLSGLIKHDPKARLTVKKILTKLDNDAAQLLMEGINIFTVGANKIKRLIDDYNLKTSKCIINFHNIKWDFSGDLNKDLNEIYKRLVSIVNLLKNFVKEQETQKKVEEKEEVEIKE